MFNFTGKYLEEYSSPAQQLAHRGWHPRTGKNDWLEEGGGMGDGGGEGWWAMGDGGWAAGSVTPDTDGTHMCIFESLQLEDSYVGDLLFHVTWKHQDAEWQMLQYHKDGSSFRKW